MGDKELKVTDKRMFNADGELREEYRHLDRAAEAEAGAEAVAEPEAEASAAEAPAEPATATPAAPVEAAPAPQATPRSGAEAAGEAPPPTDEGPAPGETTDDAPRLEIPGTGLGEPTFLDLVTLLAEPIALYLGDAQLPDGESAENLDMARLHIDLLEVLRRKTAGNLEVGESRLLEDLLYRCRLRYVQKRG